MSFENLETSSQALKIIVKSSGIVLIGMAFAKISAYIYKLIIARYLGPADFGLFSLGIVVVSFAVYFSNLAMDGAILRYAAFYKGKNDESRVKGVLFSAFKISLPLSIVGAILLFLFSDFVSINFFHDIRLSILIKILSICVPFTIILNFFTNFTQSLQKIKYNIIVRDFFSNIVKLILTAILLYLGLGIAGASIAYSVSVIAGALLLFYFSRKVFPILDSSIKTIEVKREMLSFAFPLFFTGILSGLLVRWLDSLLIGYYKNVEWVGIYNAAFPTAELMTGLTVSLLPLLIPVLTEFYSRGKIDEAKETFNTVTKWIFMIGIAPLFLVFIFSSQIISILFGPEYVSGSTALILLSLGFFISSASTVMQNILVMLKKVRILAVVGITSGIINVVLNLFLIPTYGIDGAAATALITFSFVWIILFFFTNKFMKYQPFGMEFAKIIFSGVVSISSVIIINSIFEATPIWLLFLSGFLFFGIYGCLLFLLKSFDERDKEILRAIRHKIRF